MSFPDLSNLRHVYDVPAPRSSVNIGLKPRDTFYDNGDIITDKTTIAAFSNILNLPLLQSWTVSYANKEEPQRTQYPDFLARLVTSYPWLQWELFYGVGWFGYLSNWSSGHNTYNLEEKVDAAEGLYKTILYRIGLATLEKDETGVYVWPDWER